MGKFWKNHRKTFEALIFIALFCLVFIPLGMRMGTKNMLNTIMQTSYSLLIETCFFLMAICVLTGALGKLLVDFGVVNMLEKILRPLMKPLFNLPGVAALGAVLTFLSDNPAIITLAKDRNFSQYFKKYQLVSLTNFGTAFGMGLIVIAFMAGQGYGGGALVGLFGAVCGCVVSTRLMQRFTLRAYPEYDSPVLSAQEMAALKADTANEHGKRESTFIRALNGILDGGKTGVEIGLAIIPGVLVISTAVMMITFGPAGEDGAYTGVAYEGVRLLPWAAGKIDFVFRWLFGFNFPELVAFPITALGAVGAALGLVPKFVASGFLDNNAVAVCTAIGMCWSGFLSTHTAMLDSLGYRHLISKAILAHTLGGLAAGIVAHFSWMLIAFCFPAFDQVAPVEEQSFIHYTDETLDAKTQMVLGGVVSDMRFPDDPSALQAIIRNNAALGYEEYAGSHPGFASRYSLDTIVDSRGFRTLHISHGGESKYTFIYIHGGGYYVNMIPLQRDFIEALLERVDCDIYIPLYPLAPKYHVDDTFQMLLELYSKVRGNGKPLFIMGDSAGGTITLSFTLYAKKLGLDLPEAIFPISPMADMTLTNPEIEEYAQRDPVLNLDVAKSTACWMSENMNPRDPNVSPIYGKMEGMPRTLFFVASDDLLCPDAMACYENMKSAGVHVSMLYGKHLWHVAVEYPIPARDQYLDEVVRFIK